MIDALNGILFTDIETVSQKATYAELDDMGKQLWEDQCVQSYTDRNHLVRPELTDEVLSKLYVNKAGIHAEFGQIICIGVGYFHFDTTDEPILRVKTITGDEKSQLIEFNEIAKKFQKFCAHNGKKFDYPYLARRMLLNGIIVPESLDTRNKKPWEINNIDTQDMWRFGDMVYPSLEMLNYVFGVPFKKSIDGNEIGPVFRSGGIKQIADYCADDIVALANIYVRLLNPILKITKVQKVLI
jgi:hypothetical protein